MDRRNLSIGTLVKDALEIIDFLPFFNEQEYTSYLYRAFETNHANGIYHFAFLAYYMLMMRFVCIKVWQINKMGRLRGQVSQNLKSRLVKEDDPLLGLDPEQSGMVKVVKRMLPEGNPLQILVNLRNGIAHANGNLHISSIDSFESRLHQVNAVIADLQSYSENTIASYYSNFLVSDHIIDEDEDLHAYVEESFVRKSYLSKKDVDCCVNSASVPLSGLYATSLHQCLRQFYSSL